MAKPSVTAAKKPDGQTLRNDPLGMPTAVAEKVRDLVVRGALSPGEHLGQAELAVRFGVSRMPVREALKQLAADGIVSHDPNRGYFVARLSKEEATQLYRIRRWLESQLLETLEWPDPERLAEIRAQLDQTDEFLLNGDWSRWKASLNELRKAIFDLSTQKVMLQEALRLWALTDRYRLLMPPSARIGDERAGSGERALLDAMAVRDRSALLEAFHRDRDRIEAILFDALDNA